jgi:hypothetical protein
MKQHKMKYSVVAAVLLLLTIVLPVDMRAQFEQAPGSASEGTYTPFSSSDNDRSPFSSRNDIIAPPSYAGPGGNPNGIVATPGGCWILIGLGTAYGIFRRRRRGE